MSRGRRGSSAEEMFLGFPWEGKKLQEGVWGNQRSRFPHEGGLGGV